MKKILLLGLVVVLMLCFVGCTPKMVVSSYMKSVINGQPNTKRLSDIDTDDAVATHIPLDYEVLSVRDDDDSILSDLFRIADVKVRVTFETVGGYTTDEIVTFRVMKFKGLENPYKIRSISRAGD